MNSESLADLIDIGIAHRTLPGEQESGDAYVVSPFDRGILVAVIDGLGHGPEAAQAAQLARGALQAESAAGVVTLIQRCHTALRQTRGAVMTLVQIHLPGPTITWVGVGNVEGRLLREHSPHEHASHPSEAVMLMGGVVGYQLPALKSGTLALNPGDTLMLATDGLRPGALETLSEGSGGVQELADSLLAAHGRDTDDALVLVARYRN
jgi:negative regulator of sigma-B (phosphoserine phosphatase)